MTLRANEIGADTFSRTNRELDKNNLDTTPNETEHRHAYPELAPGRALLDIETGDLYELMHRVNGQSEAVGGNKTSFEERLDYKYGTPKGQDWGGIIQQYYISFATRESPSPNHHGEIQAPITRPSEHEITDLQPSSFRSQVLTDDDGSPRPFVLLERPEVTYEEIIPGDTYDVVGWYWPNADTPADRVKPVEQLPHRFPSIAGVGASTRTTLRFSTLDVELPWDDVDTDTDAVQFAPTDTDDAFTVSVTPPDDDFHITDTGGQFVIDNPYEANETVKSISSWVNWNDTYDAYSVDASSTVLAEMIRTYTGAGYTLTVDASTMEAFASVDTDIEPDEYVELPEEDILTYAFTEEVTVGSTIDVPGIDLVIDTTDIDSDIVAFNTTDDGDITVTGVDEPNENHIRGVVDGKLGIDAAKKDKEYVKNIDWEQYRYAWDNSYGAWTVNADGAGAIIASFADADATLTASVTALAQVSDADTITETRDRAVDNDAVTGVDSYEPGVFTDVFDYGDYDVTTDADADTFVHGMGVSGDADAMTLTALDMTIADTGSNDGINVTLDTELDVIPDTVQSMWEPAHNDIGGDDAYAWWMPETGSRVEVVPVDGWGTEYELHVDEHDEPGTEHVVTLADERMMVQTVITHMKAMGR